MVNVVWMGMLLVAVVCGAFTGHLGDVGNAALSGAQGAVTLAIGLAGGYALWSGLLRIWEESGLVTMLMRALRAPVTALFGRDAVHVAGEPLLMNIAANLLGLGNAATPAGVRAICAMASLMRDGRASDAMCMLLIVNASSIQLLPTSVITLRTAAGSAAPAEIVIPTLLATAVSTVVGVILAKLCAGKGR